MNKPKITLILQPKTVCGRVLYYPKCTFSSKLFTLLKVKSVRECVKAELESFEEFTVELINDNS